MFEDERRQHLGLLQEMLRLGPRLCEHVVEAEDAGDEEVEEEAVEAGEAEDAGADPAEDGERGAGEVERLVVLHDVPHVQRLRVRGGCGGADHLSRSFGPFNLVIIPSDLPLFARKFCGFDRSWKIVLFIAGNFKGCLISPV